MKVDLRTQLDVFIETEIEDNKERIIDNENIDLGDIDSIYSINIYYIINYLAYLSDVSECQGTSNEFINILRLLLLIPSDPIYGKRMWKIINSTINQILLLSSEKLDCDIVNIEEIKVFL